MSVGRLLRSTYLLYFSQPTAQRALYRAVRSRAIRSIVELGIDLACRTPRLLEIASWRRQCLPLRYTGIDLFEARPGEHSRLTLKQAFAALRRPGLSVQLVPGDPAGALRRVANSLTATDLLIISSDQDRESMAAAWIWVPRMLTSTSLVFLQQPGDNAGQAGWKLLTPAEICRLAADANKSVRRAA